MVDSLNGVASFISITIRLNEHYAAYVLDCWGEREPCADISEMQLNR